MPFLEEWGTSMGEMEAVPVVDPVLEKTLLFQGWRGSEVVVVIFSERSLAPTG